MPEGGRRAIVYFLLQLTIAVRLAGRLIDTRGDVEIAAYGDLEDQHLPTHSSIFVKDSIHPSRLPP